jgi:hypothetical protein
MKAILPVLLTLLLLGAVILTPVKTNGQTPNGTPTLEVDAEDDNASDSEDVDDDPVDRVARITFLQGDVSFLRAGVQEWSDAAENLPLLTGDQIYVGSRGRVEIQFGRGNYVRLSEKTALTITELSDTAALLEVTEGIAIIRLERYGSAWERFEVDTPNSALVLKQDGVYRVNVRGEQDSEVIVRKGLAEVFADDGNFKLREGQRLTVDTTPNGRLQIAADTSNDDWDRWSYDRDRQADYVAVQSAPDYVNQYETDYNSFYGASDLTSYGSWTNYSDYGQCWVPRVSAGWAPYRAGQWIWIPRAGWTWLSNEPWGWAPYHYGRWVFLNNIGWAWSPGFNTRRYQYGRSYYQWRPALVGFFNCPSPRGSYVGWYPLSPGDRWRRSGTFGGDGFRGNNGHRHLQLPVARDAWRRPNDRGGDSSGGSRGDSRGNRRGNDTLSPVNRHGVTVLPVEGFAGNGRTRFRPNAPDRDLNTYVNTRARSGLPDLGANTNAYVNAKVAKQGDAQNAFRPVVKPPQEVVGRAVVTRQRPAETQAGTDVPRERRYLGTPAFTQNGNETPNNKRAQRNLESGRVQGGATTANDAGLNPGRRSRNGEAANGSAGNGSANGVITDETIRKRLGRPVEDRPETQKGNASNNDDNTVNWKNRARTIPAPTPEGDADANVKKRERAGRPGADQAANGESYRPNRETRPRKPADDTVTESPKSDAARRVYVPREEQGQGDSQRDGEERKARRAERQEQERQQEQQRRQEQERQQQQEQERQQQRQQQRAERQEQERQRQHQEQQQQYEQQRQEQERQRQHEQRRAERQQQQEQEQRRQQQEQQQRHEERQQRQQQEQQQQQQKHEEKQRRKNGDN